jgi:hypothetical protein
VEGAGEPGGELGRARQYGCGRLPVRGLQVVVEAQGQVLLGREVVRVADRATTASAPSTPSTRRWLAAPGCPPQLSPAPEPPPSPVNGHRAGLGGLCAVGTVGVASPMIGARWLEDGRVRFSLRAIAFSLCWSRRR